MKFKNLLLTTVLLFGVVLGAKAQAWDTAGNVGTATSFLGTTNNSPIEFRVNNTFSGTLTFAQPQGVGIVVGDATSYGFNSLKGGVSNLSSAFGSYALHSATAITENSAFGAGSLMNTTTGSANTALGAYAMRGNVTGDNSVAIGYAALSGNTNGVGNIAIGFESMPGAGSGNISIGYRAFWNSTASGNIGLGGGVLSNLVSPATHNVAVGAEAGLFLSTGNGNSFFGRSSGRGSLIITDNTGGRNSFFGYDSGVNISSGSANSTFGTFSGSNLTTGAFNSFFGIQSGLGLTTGTGNTFLGNVQVPSTLATVTSAGNDTSNTIILADGTGIKQRLYIHSNGFAGIGLGNNVIPKNTVEIKAVPGSPSPSGTGISGLRLASLPNGNFNTLTTNATNKVLSVNKFGDVILVDDATGGVTNTCATGNFLPKVNPINTNNFICSQVFDNGTSVGIGTGAQTPTFFNYTGGAGVFGTNWPPFTGTNRLVVNGSTRALAYFVTSDKKFKRDIKSIDSALKTVEALEGKTYFWNKKSNETIEFDDAPHSGFLAQEVEKILPHLVITDEKGNKSVNYLEMIPYLVESIKEQQVQIKEQQAQITELKNTISENFKSQNDDVIKLENTKIINVSPNPSSDVITVSLNIEKTVQNAKLQVYDLNGTLLSSLNVNERENNVTKTLQKDNFGKGIYIVSLVINGKSIDTKRIIFN